MKGLVETVLRNMNRALLQRPGLRQFIIRWSRKLGFYLLLKRIITRAYGHKLHAKNYLTGVFHSSAKLSDLQPKTRRILQDLKQAKTRQRRGR